MLTGTFTDDGYEFFSHSMKKDYPDSQTSEEKNVDYAFLVLTKLATGALLGQGEPKFVEEDFLMDG